MIDKIEQILEKYFSEELEGELISLIEDSPCHECDYWNAEGCYCHQKSSRRCAALAPFLSRLTQFIEAEKQKAREEALEEVGQLIARISAITLPSEQRIFRSLREQFEALKAGR